MIRLVDALACHRATRLITADDLTAPIREGVISWSYKRAGLSIETAATETITEFAQEDPDCPRMAQLWSCRWCASVWCAAGIVLTRRVAPKAWESVATVLALSSLAALISRLED